MSLIEYQSEGFDRLCSARVLPKGKRRRRQCDQRPTWRVNPPSVQDYDWPVHLCEEHVHPDVKATWRSLP